MSQIEKIVGELRGLMAGVEKSRGLAASVDSKAQEVMIRAGSSGFTAVAAGMARLRAAVSTIQGGLGGVAGAISEAAAMTATVPRRGTPQETVSGLMPAKGAIVRARDAATGAIAQISEAKQLVAMVLQGGQPGPLLQALDGVKEVLVLMVQRTGAAGDLVDAAIGEAGQLGSSGN